MLIQRMTPILLLFILSNTSFSQIPKWTALKMFVGYSFDNSAGIAIDRQNNYYLSSNLSNARNLGIDSLIIDCTSFPNPQNNTKDGFLLRYDSSKKLNLVLRNSGLIGVSGVDSAGNMYVSGVFTLGSQGNGSITKFSPAGTKLWTKTVESSAASGFTEDIITSMDIAKDGTICFSGFSYGTQVSIFGQSISGPVNFVSKATKEGNVIWINNFSSSLGRGAYRVKFDNSGNVLVAGNQDSSNNLSAVIAKINGSTGALNWKRTYLSTGLFVPWAKAIGVLSNGYMFGGEYGGQINISGNLLTSKGETDIFLIHCDTSGNLRWLRSGGSTEKDLINYITTNSNNNIVFTGGYSDGFLFNGMSYNAKGNLDAYVASLDVNGNSLWFKTGGSNIPGHTDDLFYNEYGSAVAIDSKNQIEIIGTSIGSGNFGALLFTAPEEARQNVFWLTLGDKESNLLVASPCDNSIARDTVFDISVSPNPFFNTLIIRNSKNLLTEYELGLYNSFGQKVKQVKYSGSTPLTINTWDNLPAGIYFLHIKTPQLSKAFKLSKR